MAAGQTESRRRSTKPVDARRRPPAGSQPAPAQPITLDDAHKVFRHWLGEDYDTDALDAMLAAVAVEKFDDGSDPVWLLIISGPGNAKTETVQALDGIGAIVTSTITSEAALLSATPKRERAKDATGGLLRKIGERGVLVIKDVTSMLSMDRNIRGRCSPRCARSTTAAGIATSAPTAGAPSTGGAASPSSVPSPPRGTPPTPSIATMGDRFVLVRIDSTDSAQRRWPTSHRQHRRRDRRCAPSWPPRWPGSSPE